MIPPHAFGFLARTCHAAPSRQVGGNQPLPELFIAREQRPPFIQRRSLVGPVLALVNVLASGQDAPKQRKP